MVWVEVGWLDFDGGMLAVAERGRIAGFGEAQGRTELVFLVVNGGRGTGADGWTDAVRARENLKS